MRARRRPRRELPARHPRRDGLGFPVLQALNPRLVLCSISGFGQTGPYREWRAFDPIIQAISGISSVTGQADQPPLRCGAAVSDTTAALYGVIGILSALRARERTGQGDWVDVSMLDGSFFLLPDLVEFATGGGASARRGNSHPTVVPFNVYRARDGWFTMCAVAPREWQAVLRALGKPELAADPRFGEAAVNRRAHREDIDALIGEWAAGRTVAEAVETFQAHHVASGPVREVGDAIEDEHLLARQMVTALEHPLHGTVPGARGMGMPIKFQNHPAAFDRAAPALGAHNAEVYGRMLGLSGEELDALRANEVSNPRRHLEEGSMFHLIWYVIVGFIIGLIARALTPGIDQMGFIATTLVGIVGSLIGGLIGNLFRRPEPRLEVPSGGLHPVDRGRGRPPVVLRMLR